MEEKETTEKTEEKTEEKPEAKGIVDEIRKEREAMDETNKVKADLLAREEAMMAKRELGGGSEAGAQPIPEKKMTDVEYAEALQRGEVNPMKEDGFI